MYIARMKTGYNDLSSEDREWAQGLKPDRIGEYITDAVRENSAPRLKFLFTTGNFELEIVHRTIAVAAAVKHRKREALRTTLATGDVYLGRTGQQESTFLKDMFSQAPSPDIWDELCTFNRKRAGKFSEQALNNTQGLPFLKPEEVAQVAVTSRNGYGLNKALLAARAETRDPNAVFIAALWKAAGENSVPVETIREITDKASRFSVDAAAYGKALQTAAGNGAVGKAQILLPLSSSEDIGQALVSAANRDQPLDYLVEALADRKADLRTLPLKAPRVMIGALAGIVDAKIAANTPQPSALPAAELPVTQVGITLDDDNGMLKAIFNPRGDKVTAITSTQTSIPQHKISELPDSEQIRAATQVLARAALGLRTRAGG